MPLKRNRQYRLLVDTQNADFTTDGFVGPALPETAKQSSSLPLVQSLEITPPLTLEFNVSRNNLASVNTAQMTVYNLGQNTRTLLHIDRWHTDVYRPIELWAGYGNGQVSPLELATNTNKASVIQQLFPRIFRGNVQRCYSVRQGNNFLTKFECFDGGIWTINSHVKLSYAAGVPWTQIIEDLINSVPPGFDPKGNAFPSLKVGAIGNFPGVTRKATTFTGNAIDRLMEITGGRFFIDGERGYALNSNEYLAAPSVPVLTDDNGILGIPEKETTFVRMEILFEPGITVEQKITLKTRTVPYYNGDYIVKGLTHRGMISNSVCGTVTTELTLDSLDPNARLVTQR